MNSESASRVTQERSMDQPNNSGTQRIKWRNNWKGKAAPSRKWICEGWLSYRLTLFTGHGGVGKSQLALQLAAAVASDSCSHWIPSSSSGHMTSTEIALSGGHSVLVASWEDEADEVHRRLSSMAESLPWAAVDKIRERLHFADLAGKGPLWDRRRQRDEPMLTEIGEELQALAKQIEARLLIIDPRAAAYGGDENHRAQVRAFVSHWDRWARDSKCAVLLIDHLPKTAVQAGFARGSPYAGSTDWHNAPRCVWTLDEQHTLHCEKSNYGSTPDPVSLIREGNCSWSGMTDSTFRSARPTSANPFGAD